MVAGARVWPRDSGRSFECARARLAEPSFRLPQRVLQSALADGHSHITARPLEHAPELIGGAPQTTGYRIREVHRYQHRIDRVHLRGRKSTRLNSSHVKISYAVFC